MAASECFESEDSEFDSEVGEESALRGLISGEHARDLELEENVFGGFAMTLTQTSFGQKRYKSHMFVLMVAALFLQATFALILIPRISKDEYKQKISGRATEGQHLQKDMKVCSIQEGMLDWKDFRKEIPVGLCGVVANVDHSDGSLFLEWSNGQISRLRHNSWSKYVNASAAFRDSEVEANQFEDWRKGDGDFVYGGKVWAYWVCKGQDFSWYESVVDNLAKYNTPIFPYLSQGVFFGTSALFLWSLTIMVGFRKAWDFMLIAHPGLRLYDKSSEGNVIAVAGPHACMRSIVFFIFLLRAMVLLGTLLHGVKFLCYTDNLKDFILNSIALAFVVDIPDLLFKALASDNEISAVRQFNGNCMAQVPKLNIINAMSGVGWAAFTILVVVLGLWRYLLPFASELDKEVHRKLCSQDPWKEGSSLWQ